jgi:hypothetical protein
MYSLMIMAVFLIVLNCMAIANAATAPAVVWSQQFSNSPHDMLIHSAWQTSDGGYILAGSGVDPGTSTVKAYLVKTDANGNKQWDKYYDKYSGMAYSVQQTSDGGYIFSGDAGGAGTGFMAKTDASGNVQWEKTNASWGILYSIKQTADGGYVATGWVEVGYANVLLVKVDASGNTVWEQHFDYIQTSIGYGVWPTSDGGYAIAGSVDEGDGWLGKTDANGVMQWDQWFNSTGALCAVQQTRDGGYILTGKNAFARIVIKTDSTGNQQWMYKNGSGAAYAVQQTWDDGYVVGVYPGGSLNTTIVKLDNNGNEQWTKTLDASYDDRLVDAGSVQQIGIGNFIVGWASTDGKNEIGVLTNLSSDMTPVPNAQFVSDTIPSTMNAGASYTVSLTFLNSGTKPWTVQDNTTMSPVVGTDAAKFGATTNVSPQVATIVRPGQSYTFTMTLTAPAMNGTYHPKFQMVWENHQMFGAVDDHAVKVINGTPDTNGDTSTVTPVATAGSTAIASSNPSISSTPSAQATAAATTKSGLPCLSALALPLLIVGTVIIGKRKQKNKGN